MIKVEALDKEALQKPVYLYGCTDCGSYVLENIENSRGGVIGFVDQLRQGQTFQGKPVVDISAISDVDSYTFVICAANAFWKIVKVLEARGVKKCYHAVPITHEVPSTQENFWAVKYENCVSRGEGKIYAFSIVLTERCSLKCKHCAEYAPYLKTPKHFDVDDTFQDVEKALDAVGEVQRVGICGGEIFVHPEWARMVRMCLDEPRIKHVAILTNATIIPQDYEVLQDKKVELILDDYGQVNKLNDLISFCREHEIAYSIRSLDFWFNIQKTPEKSKTKEERYSDCYMKNECWVITDGFLYQCTASYFIMKYVLGVDIAGNENFINLRTESVEEIRQDIKKLLNIKALSACEYCGGTYASNMIPVAEQMDIHDKNYQSLPRK